MEMVGQSQTRRLKARKNNGATPEDNSLFPVPRKKGGQSTIR